MRPLEQEPKKISQVLPAVLRKLGLEERAGHLTLAPLWRQIVGPNVSCHSSPARLERGCLWVTVDTPVWKMELERCHKDEIMRKLAAKDPRIKGLKFIVGQIS